MSDEEEAGVVILLRYTYETALMPQIVPGSFVTTCNCGHKAWMSLETQFFLADTARGRASYTFCSDCYSFEQVMAEIKKNQTEPYVVPGYERSLENLPSEEQVFIRRYMESLGFKGLEEG